MSTTNQERTRLINAINREDVAIVSMSPGLLDTLCLKPFIPASIDDLLHRYISTFYMFNPIKRNEDGKALDGLLTWIDADHGNGRKYAIGIGVDTLDNPQGEDYLLLIVCHELTHAVLDAEGHPEHADHGELFHSYLNQLLLAINDYTGKSLKNDLYGYESE